jgi:hypothetical protein
MMAEITFTLSYQKKGRDHIKTKRPVRRMQAVRNGSSRLLPDPVHRMRRRLTDISERIRTEGKERADRAGVAKSSKHFGGTDPYDHFGILETPDQGRNSRFIIYPRECCNGRSPHVRFRIVKSSDQCRKRCGITKPPQCDSRLAADSRVAVAKRCNEWSPCRRRT